MHIIMHGAWAWGMQFTSILFSFFVQSSLAVVIVMEVLEWSADNLFMKYIVHIYIKYMSEENALHRFGFS